MRWTWASQSMPKKLTIWPMEQYEWHCQFLWEFISSGCLTSDSFLALPVVHLHLHGLVLTAAPCTCLSSKFAWSPLQQQKLHSLFLLSSSHCSWRGKKHTHRQAERDAITHSLPLSFSLAPTAGEEEKTHPQAGKEGCNSTPSPSFLLPSSLSTWRTPLVCRLLCVFCQSAPIDKIWKFDILLQYRLVIHQINPLFTLISTVFAQFWLVASFARNSRFRFRN